MTEQRFRNFSCVLYEESVSPNFVQIIDSWHVPCFLSPYHDSDKDTEKLDDNGNPTIKKPHWHLLYMSEGKKSVDGMRALFSSIGGVGLEVVQSIRGAARYLCHLDNPEKAQYSSVFVKCFAGADYTDIISSEADRAEALKKIIAYIDDHQIKYFHQLLNSLIADGEKDLYRLSCFSCNAPVNQYIRSKAERQKNMEGR